MKISAVLSLVLILCYFCRAQRHSGNSNILLRAPDVESGEERAQTQRAGIEAEGGERELVPQTDIWTELRDLRDMVVEQRVELRHLTTRVTAAESLVEALRRENTALEARMTAAERLVAQLQTENDAQDAELAAVKQQLSTLQQRVTVSEGRMAALEKDQEAQDAEIAANQQQLGALQERVTASEGRVAELEKEQGAQSAELAAVKQQLGTLQQRVTASEGRVAELEREQEVQNTALQQLENASKVRKVAFSASLRTSGAGNISENPLRYRNVFTNTGNHYNPNTGYFTAPIRGVYYFRFDGHSSHSNHMMIMHLIKNGRLIVTAADLPPSPADLADNASNGAVLQLEVGDIVSVSLSGEVWDDNNNRTTFSGFLLFPL
ncbi:hypothetical protein ABVT39_010375 [Epinephelus coioides]